MKLLKWSLVTFYVLPIIILILAWFLPSDFSPQRIQSTKIQMLSIGDRLREFKNQCGRYPFTSEGLNILLEGQANKIKECKLVPLEGFFESSSLPTNPWGNEFRYKSDRDTFVITTIGDGWKFTLNEKKDFLQEEVKYNLPIWFYFIYAFPFVLIFGLQLQSYRKIKRSLYGWAAINVSVAVGWVILAFNQLSNQEPGFLNKVIITFAFFVSPLIFTFFYFKNNKNHDTQIEKLAFHSGALVSMTTSLFSLAIIRFLPDFY